MEAYYKCLTPERTGGYSGFVWPDEGVPLEPVEGDLELCRRGYHVCTINGLLQWDCGGDVYEFVPDGDFLVGRDKVCFRGGRLGKKVWWTDRERRLFACDCAERALIRERNAGRDPDERSWAAVEVARGFAVGEADEAELVAARVAASAAWAANVDGADSAAWAASSASADSADSAAWAASSASADSAAWAAEIKWQTERLRQYLYGEVL